MKKNSLKNTILLIIMPMIILIFSQLVSTLITLFPIPEFINNIIFGISYLLVSYFLIKIFIKKMGYKLEDFRIPKIKINLLYLIIAVILPLFVILAYFCINGDLSVNNLSTLKTLSIITYALFVVGLGAGVVEELVFRGIIMASVEKRWGTLTSILIPSIMFGIIHIVGVKLGIIDFLCLFFAGTLVGIMFSLITYFSKSVWNSAVVHGIWNMCIIGGILSISDVFTNKAILTYKINSDNFLLTGGLFGIEASIISIIGYLFVIVFVLIFSKSKKHKN